MPDDYSEVVQGKKKIYDKEVTLVIKQPDDTRRIVRAFICPDDWKFIRGSGEGR